MFAFFALYTVRTLADTYRHPLYLQSSLSSCPPKVIIIDETSIQKNLPLITRISSPPLSCGDNNPDVCVNDDIANPNIRTKLFTRGKDITGISTNLTLRTGSLDDPGMFTFMNPNVMEYQRGKAGKPFTIVEYVNGSGNAADEANLDQVEGVAMYSGKMIINLVGKTVCAVVYKKNIQVTDTRAGLQGSTAGITAFVVSSSFTKAFSSTRYFPSITVKLLRSADVDFVCSSDCLNGINRSHIPTGSPTVDSSISPSICPSSDATPSPSKRPQSINPATICPSMCPSITPTISPHSVHPTTICPSMCPSAIPTISPHSVHPTTICPSICPSAIPTASPHFVHPTTICPSMCPSFIPTISPHSLNPTSICPSMCPSVTPTISPHSVHPTTICPSVTPTISPHSVHPTTICPSMCPSVFPTISPHSVHPTTICPSVTPTISPHSVHPTTIWPSICPSFTPTISPHSMSPTTIWPSICPSFTPTISPHSMSPTTIWPSICPSFTPTINPHSMTPKTIWPSICPSFTPTISPHSMTPTVLIDTHGSLSVNSSDCWMNITMSDEIALVDQPKTIKPLISLSNSCYSTTSYSWRLISDTNTTIHIGQSYTFSIPAFTLPPLSTYKVLLDVTVSGNIFNSEINLIVRSQNLVAKIDGGSKITAQVSEGFNLTTSSKYDPDNIATAFASVYQWACTASNQQSECPDLSAETGDKLSISRGQMTTVGEYVFTFLWTVTYRGRNRSNEARMVVNLEAKPIPRVKLTGSRVANEGGEYRIASDIRPAMYDQLEGLTYHWNVSAPVVLLTSTSGPDFACRDLVGGQTYTFRLAVSSPNSGVAKTELAVTVNRAPVCSGMTADPNTGVALQTTFTLTVNSCFDPDEKLSDLPLTFEIWTNRSLIANGLSSNTFATNALPPGDPLVVRGYASDWLGARSAGVEVFLNVSNPGNACIVQAYIDKDIASSARRGQFSKVLSEVTAAASVLRSGSWGCKRSNSVVDLTNRLVQAVNSSTVSLAQSEASASAIATVSGLVERNSSSALYIIDRLMGAIVRVIDTRPMKASNTFFSVGKSLDSLARLSDCKRLDAVRGLVERAVAIASRKQVIDETDKSFQFASLTATSQGFNSALKKSTLKPSSPLLSHLTVQIPRLHAKLAGNVQMVRFDPKISRRCSGLEQGGGDEIVVGPFAVSVSGGEGEIVDVRGLEKPIEFRIGGRGCEGGEKCVYHHVGSGKWISDGCETLCEGLTILCRCTHLTEFAVLKSPKKSNSPSPSEYIGFYALTAIYLILSNVSLMLIVINVFVFRKWKKCFWHNGSNIAVWMLCGIRSVLALWWSGDLKNVVRISQIWLIILTTLPYVLFCWVLALLCTQWTMVFFSMKGLRIVKFSDYRKIYFSISALATLPELALSISAFTVRGENNYHPVIYMLASITIATVSLALALGFLIFGNLLGCALLGTKRNSTAKVILSASWVMGVGFIVEAALWLAAVCDHPISSERRSLLISYGIMLIPISMSVFLMAQKARVNYRNSKAKRSKGRRKSSQHPSASRDTRPRFSISRPLSNQSASKRSAFGRTGKILMRLLTGREETRSKAARTSRSRNHLFGFTSHRSAGLTSQRYVLPKRDDPDIHRLSFKRDSSPDTKAAAGDEKCSIRSPGDIKRTISLRRSSMVSVRSGKQHLEIPGQQEVHLSTIIATGRRASRPSDASSLGSLESNRMSREASPHVRLRYSRTERARSCSRSLVVAQEARSRRWKQPEKVDFHSGESSDKSSELTTSGRKGRRRSYGMDNGSLYLKRISLKSEEKTHQRALTEEENEMADKMYSI